MSGTTNGTKKKTARAAGAFEALAGLAALAALSGNPRAAGAPAGEEAEGAPPAEGVEVTVYNQDLAMVKDRRTIVLPPDGVVRFRNVPSRIDATTVAFRSFTDPAGTHVLEQNYEFDLVSAQRLLDKYIDQRIQVTTADGSLHEGTLLSFDDGSLVLQQENGIEMVARGEHVRSVRLASLPEGLLTRPTLVWRLGGERRGEHQAEVSYLTGGLSWQADYVAIANEDDTRLDLSAWVTLNNRSGASYRDATLKLIAGDVNRVRGEEVFWPPAPARGPETDDRGGGFEQESFFEFHLYTLPRTTTIADNQMKQVALFEPRNDVPVEKIYRYQQGFGEKVQVRLQLENAEENHLGIPLPAGRIRLSKADPSGSLQFIGEDRIDHTPRDEEIELTLGNAFDLVGEFTAVEQRQIARNVSEQVVEYHLRNHKEEGTDPVTILVTHNVGTNWEILDFPANLSWERKDAHTIEFPVPVPPGKDGVKARFRVRWTSP